MDKVKNKSKAGRGPDKVLREIWHIKDTRSAARGHDVQKLFAEARERQKHSGHRVVNFSGPRKQPANSHA
jgi:hypothetical protein